MKTAAILAFAAGASAHATFQEMLVNGKSQGSTGVRGTSNQNNPIYSTAEGLASDMMVCKGGEKVTGQVKVAGGDKLTLQWHHNNPMSSGDSDEPIAASHKGPIIVWLAKASTEGKGKAWVKLQQDGLTSNGDWAVDTFRTNAGAIDVTIPKDLASGDYLIRPEIIALHEGDRAGKAQFYNGCGQITVTSSGSETITDGVDITSVYKTDDAGVLYNIYGGSTEYTFSGPEVLAGLGAGSGSAAPATSSKAAVTKEAEASAAPASSSKAAAQPTTLSTAVKSSSAAPAASSAAAPAVSSAAAPAVSSAAAPAVSSAAAPAVSSAAAPAASAPASGNGSSSGSVKKYHQCGGANYTGATECEEGSTCKVQNPYYSQCV